MNDQTAISFNYRTASAADSRQLLQLGLISYSQYFPLLTEENRAQLDSGLRDEEKLNALMNISTCFVCEHEGKIVGMAHIILSGNPWDIFPADWSYIRMVGVNPDYNGKGIAKTLTKLCIERAKKSGENLVALHTSEHMHAARRIYESLGFKKIKEIEPRLGMRYWLYHLHL
jgi:ribosomal protein S18 acetylase RimI-like enzyme